MSSLGDLNEFVKYARNSAWDTIKKNPARLLYGAVDPASTWAWNKVLGRDDKPILNQLGSPMGGGGMGLNKNGGVYADARRDGLSRGEVGQGQTFFGIGDTIAGIYGGSALGSAAGLGEGGSTANGMQEAFSGGSALGSGEGGAGSGILSGFSGTAGGSASTYGNMANAGAGMMSRNQPQMGQNTVVMQAPDPQAEQRRRIQMLQETQLQQLRQKPNKTMEEWQMLQQATKNQGLLGMQQ